MMKEANTRYVMSMGLAFDEEGDMRKLSKLAAEGWLLSSFAALGYRLRRGEPQQLTYCLDYHDIPAEELNQYVELFEAAGWQHICSQSSMHIFAATPGTKPIYTDKSTMRSKYAGITKSVGWVLAVTAPAALVLSALSRQMAGKGLPSAAGTLMVLSAIGIGISVAAAMTFTAFRLRLRRLK